ncbi:hypothetical protein F7725_017006 [Dissostichus mawsoni]|uniref:Uncharacterized protein n=1 Tax=Dissostichus mawsoni TaxID=36200 RepID=A0A7J5Z448_DISMA|nr:hypothetical protein F7725_017006 [Dissostichus mawsoni]
MVPSWYHVRITTLTSRMLEKDCSSSGDVWLALSVTLSELALAECSETKVLSSFRASSSMFRSLSCSSLRQPRSSFKPCRFATVVSPV